ncbi:MAG: sortase [Candidatus Peribacteraceae bacterium]|jgi:LPXTG-site transpeptidase (sortase) family protein
MISRLFRRHRAHYDANGDIVLDPDMQELRAENGRGTAWRITEPPSPEDILDPTENREALSPSPVHGRLVSVRKHIAEDVLEEGLRQYRESLRATKPMLEELGWETSTLLQKLWHFMRQPVWVPGRKRSKEMTRGTLFLVDTVRFGGTFALIFLGLFVALNYQSFWEITSSKVLPFLTAPSIDAQDQALASALQDRLKLLPGLATAGGGLEGNILSFLPPMGPPENRLIIPKLDLNIPLVTPSYEALLRADWPQVEKDIQDALQDGVVHYPGTANPGQAGNFFVTGHSSYYPWSPGGFKTVFARLHNLEVGDEYWVYFGGDKHRYMIKGKKEVSPADITVLDQPTDKRIATLMTCTPVGTTLRRLIVTAQEIDPTTGEILDVGERPSQAPLKYKMEALPI